MSLIHWWPLNGDTRDRISGITLTNNNSAVVTTGKIGQCYQFNGTNNLSAAFTQTLPQEPTEFSFAFWIKLNSTWSGWGQVLTIGRVGADWRDIRIGLDIADNKTVYFTISNGSDNTNYSSPQYSSLAVNEWYHITGTFKNKIMHLFINGQLQASYTASFLPLLPDEPIIAIGGNGGENGECDINDVRIYDHALSKAEIQELNKALVLHYSFDDVLADGTTNLISGQTINGHGSTWTLLSDDSFYGLPIYRNTVTTPNVFNNAGFNINTSFTYTGPQSTHLCLSFWKRLNVAYSKSIGGYIEVQYTDDTKGVHSWTYNNPTWANDNNSVGQWEQVIGIVDIPPDKTIKLITCLYIYTDHALYGECDFAGIQIEAKDHPTPYTPSSRNEMLYNEAGFTQHNNIQNINLSTNAAIGTYALDCNNTFINIPMIGDVSQGATVSLWMKNNIALNDIPNQDGWVAFADRNSELGFGFYKTANGTLYGVIATEPDNANKKKAINAPSLWKDLSWNHVVLMRTSSGEYKCFINGNECSYEGIDYWSHTQDCVIGQRNGYTPARSFNGLMSDVRLYHTALSPEEIKELYSCGGRISNLGDALTGEFIEGAEKTSVNKNHTITTKEIYEQILPNGYQQLEYIESTGTQYIDTLISQDTKIRKLETSHYLTTSKTSQILFGNDGIYTFYREWDESRPNYGMYGADSGYIQTNIPMSPGFVTGTVEFTSNKIAKISITKTNNDGSVIYQVASGTHSDNFTGIGNYYLFGYNLNNALGYPCPCKMYSFKVSSDAGLIRDFIPTRRISDNTLGLYDIINNQFYINTGSGNFIAGPTLTTGQASMLHAGGLTARQIIEI